jgi:hypothetical protein
VSLKAQIARNAYEKILLFLPLFTSSDGPTSRIGWKNKRTIRNLWIEIDAHHVLVAEEAG